MANGLLAKVALVANTQTEVYQITSTVQFATVSVYVLNTSGTTVSVDIWASTSASPSLADKIVHSTEIPANGGEMAIDCRLFSASEKVFIQVSGSGCIVRVEGLEKA